MHRVPCILLVLVMTGCGVDVAGTVATSGENKAQETKQAQKIIERINKDLDAAAQAAQERAAEAEKSAGY